VTSREFRDRLLKRAKRADVGLDPVVAERLEVYYRLLARWNSKINLTAFPLEELSDRGIDRLLIEPLAAARFVPESPMVWFDLGSGGGSPALPLKIVRPQARLIMVESKTRKAAFLREAVRTLELADVVVEHGRFEGVAERLGVAGAALVTVRAVRVDDPLIEAASKLLAPGGRLFLFASDAAVTSKRGRFSVVDNVKLAGNACSRLLILR
jgi:16S rRNA (guanine527-N7)-methyltransferase